MKGVRSLKRVHSAVCSRTVSNDADYGFHTRSCFSRVAHFRTHTHPLATRLTLYRQMLAALIGAIRVRRLWSLFFWSIVHRLITAY